MEGMDFFFFFLFFLFNGIVMDSSPAEAGHG